MHPDLDFLPARGIQFARYALAIAAGKSFNESLVYAERRWGSRSTVVQMVKSDVGGHESSDADFPSAGTRDQASEFAEIVDMRGLLQGLTPVPSSVPFLAGVTSPTAGWVGQSKGVPVSRAVLSRETLQPMKVTSMVVLTDELVNASDARAELMVLSMMARTARLTADGAIADPANNGIAGAMPASVTSDATPINSSGDIADDAQAAIDAFGGNLETAVWWLRPDLAAQAGLRAGANGAGAGLGALGGTLAGLPAYTSAGIPGDSSGSPLILLDRSSVAMVDGGYQIVRSTQGTVEMSDSPSGATDTPVTAGTGTKFVSLFQAGAVGLLLIRRVNWRLANPSACIVVEDCDYSAGA